MGCCCSCCRKEVVFTDVEKATGMDTKEVNTAYRRFKRDAGAKRIKLDSFTRLVATMKTNKSGNVAEYARHLFRVIDTDKDGIVSFEEVMIAFHHLSDAGDQKEKMKLVFAMYDVDGNKLLSPANVKAITKAQYLLQGKALDDDEINNKVKACFSECDLNCDGKITEDEFFKAGRGVAEMFELED